MGLAHAAGQETIDLFWKTNWDFFSGGCGSKAGYITDLHEGGCTLKTVEPIEFRRWIRMMIHDKRTNVSFTAVGRVVRCENSFEATPGSDVTLYRYRVEFTYPLPMAQRSVELEIQDEPMLKSAASG
jgi:hypothetical protein